MDGQMYNHDEDAAAKAVHMGAVEFIKLKRDMRRAMGRVERIEECMRVFVRNTPHAQFTSMGPALEKLAELPKARASVYTAHELISQLLDLLDVPLADNEKVYDDVSNLADDDPDRFR